MRHHLPEVLKTLDAGEKAALALATARQPIFLLVDEWPARKIALVRDLPVTGTLGILDQAAHRKLVSFRAAIESLKQTSFRYPAALVNRLLAEHSGN